MTNPNHQNAVNDLLYKAEQTGRKALADLQIFLKNNPDKFPLWRDSPCNAKATTRAHGIVASCDGVGGVGFF